jgi:hypothetical protein
MQNKSKYIVSMNHNFNQALDLLGINEFSLYNEQGEIVYQISFKEHVEALFLYLHLGGYLSSQAIEKAITYLSASKSFTCAEETIIQNLQGIYKESCENEKFNVDYFLQHFCQESYYQVDDIIDLIAFMSQTAFGRAFGVERDQLYIEPWLKQHPLLFHTLATTLGVINPLPPIHDSYCGIAIMGATSSRVKSRIEYFNSLPIQCGELFALSGDRELSTGLDEENVMLEIAKSLNTPINFIKKTVGNTQRYFLDGVTETMMVDYLIQQMCSEKKISLINSAVQEKHWRVTTEQSAKDISNILLQKIQTGEITKKTGIYHFMIIAEQPYAGRMTRQIQRAFNQAIQQKNLEESIKVIVEDVGPGVSQPILSNMNTLARINSELSALMGERFKDAHLHLQQQNPSLVLRNPNIVMFSNRDVLFTELTAEVCS